MIRGVKVCVWDRLFGAGCYNARLPPWKGEDWASYLVPTGENILLYVPDRFFLLFFLFVFA